jgi:hypothetical protein
MGKKKKKSTQSKARKKDGPSAHGFDFGHLPRVMFASPTFMEFNQELIDSNVMGCAYGLAPVAGYPGHIPSLSLVCEKPEPMKKAFSYFENWGCKEDGDVVDITIVLKNDGGYLLGLQPNFSRLIERSTPDRELMDPLYFGLTWIKTLDTTNPTLLEWRQLFKSKFFPIEVSACTAKLVGGIPSFKTLEPLHEAGSFIKFSLTITTEDEEPDHFLLRVVQNPKGKRTSGRRQGPPPTTPKDVATCRQRVIDTAFPVTRERCRHLKLIDEVRTHAGFELASESQITQAVVNLQISDEIADGRAHYEGISKIQDVFFEYVRSRSELAGQSQITSLASVPNILQQLELDVAHTLRRHGATLSEKHSTNQRQFARLGYASC